MMNNLRIFCNRAIVLAAPSTIANGINFHLVRCISQQQMHRLQSIATMHSALKPIRSPQYGTFKSDNRPVSFSLNDQFPNKLTSLQIKKRPVRKKRIEFDGNFSVVAYATADEYDLERLKANLIRQNLYKPLPLLPADVPDNRDVLYATAIYHVSDEPRDIFFFREGSVVLWNCSDLECSNVLTFLEPYEMDGYNKDLVQQESESMFYKYDDNKSFLQNDGFYLKVSDSLALEKYTFSNAMTTSVKLGIWEAALDTYVDSMEFVADDLKRGRPIRISRPECLRKTGELFALRHLINLSSDLLDTPDFYWDRKELEHLYNSTCGYFAIHRRTKVMNEKLNHCIELAELVSSNLNDKHHIRLEWMIIVLIMIEVGFEILHYTERYLVATDEKNRNVKCDDQKLHKIVVS